MRKVLLTVFFTAISFESAAALECDVARQHFRSRNFTLSETCEEQATGIVCGTASNCCPLGLQEEMKHKASIELRQRLSFIEDYHREMSLIEMQLFDAYGELFSKAQEHTLSTLHIDLRFMEQNSSVEAFYKTLRTYLLGIGHRHSDDDSPNVIGAALNSLFSDIFVSVYEQTANPRERFFSNAFKSCLRQQNLALQPFGEVPQRLAAYFTKSFHVDHLVMKSVRTLIEVLKTASEANVTNYSECSRAFANLVHCPACHAYTDLAPCNRFCVNVVRGCLAPLSDLNAPWTSQVEKTIRLLKRAQETNYHVEIGLLLISQRLVEAVQYAMDNGIEVVKRVQASCGDPDGKGDLIIKATNDSSQQRTATETVELLTGPAKKLQETADTLQAKLHTILDLFETISERLCPDISNSDCWNGSTRGDYSKTLAGRGVGAQKLNPEVVFNDRMIPNYVKLVEHSLRMKQVTGAINHAAVFKMKPEIENYQVETRQKESFLSDGSGDAEPGSGDDEDDDEGSGSGAAPQDVDAEPDNVVPGSDASQENVTAATTTTTSSSQPTESSNDSSAPSVNASNICALLLPTLLMLIHRSL
ncbi:glypican-1 [Galendromus occidentalis]|uniref:Glypican-1 n=1 Tax=Galendromus occidentalis TaxID=34638 RepID=A0AAJ7SFM8_9ACAR|nr:glypican-1 [Galendromus occidentalis]